MGVLPMDALFIPCASTLDPGLIREEDLHTDLEQRANPWDVWGDDTANGGDCPERNRSQGSLGSGSAFQERGCLVVCPRL